MKKLPTDNIELRQCWGIKGKRCQQYGDSILHVINSYLQQHHPNNGQQGSTSRNNNGRSPSSANRQIKKKKAASDSGDSDDEIEIGPALSVEDIVAQRVREAEARGEVFEIL